MNITKGYSFVAEMCEVLCTIASLGLLLVLSLVGEAPETSMATLKQAGEYALETTPKSNTNIRCDDSQALRWSSSR